MTVQPFSATAPVKALAGSNTDPSITFTGDTDTGLYSPGANQVAIATGGVQRLLIGSDGSITPASPLRFPLGSAGAPSISFTGDTNTGIYSPGADQVAISTNGTGRLFVDASGRILIGTQTEGEVTGDDLTIATSGSTGITIRSGTANYGNIFFSDGTTGNDEFRGSIQYNHTDNFLTIGTNATERLRITSAGNVGIGTSAPNAVLTVDPASGNFASTYNNYDGVGLFIRGNGTAGNGNYGPALVFGCCDSDTVNQENKHCAISLVQTGSDANNTGLAFWTHPSGLSTDALEEKVRIDSSGRVGIGTTSPTSPFTVRTPNGNEAQAEFSGANAGRGLKLSTGAATLADALVIYDAQTSTGQHAFNIAGTEALRIDNSRRLLVGTSSAPSSSASARIQLVGSNDGGTLYIGNPATTIGLNGYLGGLAFGSNDDNTWGTGAQILCLADVAHTSVNKGSRLVFSTTADGASSPTERMRIDSSGNVGVGGAPASWSVFKALQIEKASIASTGDDLNLMVNAYYDGVAYRRIGTTSVGRQYFNSDGSLIWSQSGPGSANSIVTFSERMVLDSSGRLGIGTSSVARNLDISASSNPIIRLNNSTTAITSGSDIGGIEVYTNDASVDGTGIKSFIKTVAGSFGSAQGNASLAFGVAAQGVGGASEVMRLTSTGLGIGTTSPVDTLQINKNATNAASGGLTLKSADSNESFLSIGVSTSLNKACITSSENGTGTVLPIAFTVGSSSTDERMRIDSSGRLLVGTSSARTDLIAGTRGGQVQIEAASSDAANALDKSSLCLTAGNSTTAGGSANIFFTRTRSNSLGGVDLVAGNDILGGLYFQGTDGTDAVPAVLIKAEVDGTPAYAATDLVNGQTYRIVTVGTTDFTLIGASANTVGTVFNATGPGTGTGTAILNAGNMPGRLIFSTTADGASSPTERLRITSDGKLGLGTSSPTESRFHSYSGNGTIEAAIKGEITANVYPGLSTNIGGKFLAAGFGSRYGVWGEVTNAAWGPQYGGFFKTAGATTSSSYGVYAETGSADVNGLGIAYAGYFKATSAGTGINAAIYGLRVENTAAVGGTSYGAFISTVSGASTVIPFRVDHAGSTRFTIDSSGRVGVGTTSPGAILETRVDSAGGAPLGALLTNSSVIANTSIGIAFQPNTSQGTARYAVIYGINESGGSGNATGLAFHTNGNGGPPLERARIDSSGRLLVGTSTSASTYRLEVVNDSSLNVALLSGNNSAASGPFLTLRRSRGSTASPTVVSSGDVTGVVDFRGYSGAASAYLQCATIAAAIDGEPDTAGDTTDMPGRLVFSTTADGASSPTEQLRITSDRYVRLASGTGGIQFNGDTAAANALDDYEEGTWTPNQGGGLTVNGAFSSSATYIKVGNIVHVRGYLAGATNISVSAGGILCTNLPFTTHTLDGCGGNATTYNINETTGLYATGSGTTLYSNSALSASAQIIFGFTYRAN